MKAKGKGGILGVATLLVLVVTSMAAAATPSEIYADYADNGRLDTAYSTSDLENALNSAVIQGYGNPIVTPGFRTEVEQAARPEHGDDRRVRHAAVHRCRPGAAHCGRDRAALAGLGLQALRESTLLVSG